MGRSSVGISELTRKAEKEKCGSELQGFELSF